MTSQTIICDVVNTFKRGGKCGKLQLHFLGGEIMKNLLFITVLLSIGYLQASVVFKEHVISTSVDGADQIHSADINNDGNMKVAGTNDLDSNEIHYITTIDITSNNEDLYNRKQKLK